MIKVNNSRVFYLLLISFFVCINGAISCFGQDEEDKSIQSEAFTKNRPAQKTNSKTGGKSAGNRPYYGPRKKVLYRIVKKSPNNQRNVTPPKPEKQSANSMPKDMEEALLGMTVWKMRPATKNDPAKELIEEVRNGETQNSEYTLERLQSDAPLTAGEKIRLSIESLSHSGYLYVIEREFYSDRTFSSPKLIYPTLRTENGNSPVKAGDLIFIPGADRNFIIKPIQAEKKQIAEVLTIIISPRILIDQSLLQTKAIDLPLEQFSDWLKQWQAAGELLEQINGAGQAITKAEQTAGRNSAKGLIEDSLNKDDPAPQSIFRAKIKRGIPILMNVELKFSSN